jgi:hypothetical protein
MYSKLGSRLEVSLYRTKGEEGTREPIPGVGRFVFGYRSPEPMHVATFYESDTEALERFAALIQFIAREQNDDYTYVASGRWKRKNEPGLPEQWEFRAKGRE